MEICYPIYGAQGPMLSARMIFFHFRMRVSKKKQPLEMEKSPKFEGP